MIAYSLKRLAISLLIVWGIITISFVVMHLAPGDPASIYIRPDIDPKVAENIQSQLGFNQPIWKQYLLWTKEIVKGNFGLSYVHQRPINDLLADTIPNTLRLTLTVFIFQFVVGIGLGIISAIKYKTRTDHLINGIMLFFYSMPGFWLAIVSILFFSLKLGWLPSSQMQSMHEIHGFWAGLWDQIKHLILPVAVLSTPFIAYTTRFVRDSLIKELNQPYIFAAQTYGLKRSKIVYHYALKSALLPLVTLVGLYLPFMLGGAVITEYIFAWPGMGRITVNAIFTHDYALILATTIIAAIAVIIGNYISDILYAMADPRIRMGMNRQ
jgi:peptide/nickel transport system permease protein